MRRNLARNPIRLWNIFLTIVAFGLTMPASWARAQSAHGDEPMKNLALEGINQMMNGHLESAIATFQRVQKEDPASPLGYLLEADASWLKNFFTEGNFNGPDFFGGVYAGPPPGCSHFVNNLKTTTEK